MSTRQDIRQHETRVLQDQLNSAASTPMDSTLTSINSELTSPGRLIAQSTPSLVVSVNARTVANPNTGKNRALPLISNTYHSFTGGTITFPSTSGTITVSPGTNGSITMGANQYCAVLVQLNSSGQLILVTGTATSSLSTVAVPSGDTTTLALGYIIVQSDGSSVIQPITNSMIYQFPIGSASQLSTNIANKSLDAIKLTTAAASGGTGGTGGTTSITKSGFTTIQATGGVGGLGAGVNNIGGAGGTGSGGSLNGNGQAGSNGYTSGSSFIPGDGGNSFMFSGAGKNGGTGVGLIAQCAASSYGGGGGAAGNGSTGTVGFQGIVIIEQLTP